MLRFDESETTTSCAKVLVGGVANLATAGNFISPALNPSRQQATSNGQTNHQGKNRDGSTHKVSKSTSVGRVNVLYLDSHLYPSVNVKFTWP